MMASDAWLRRHLFTFIGLSVVAFSLVACMAVNLFYFPNATIFPDEGRFLASARDLIATGEFKSMGGYAGEMPGTALFFAPFVFVFGPDTIVAIRCAQALLLVLQSALIGYIAWRLFANIRTALLAVTMSAFYPFFLFYQGLLLSETLFNVLLVGSFASLMLWQSRGCRLDWTLALTCVCFAAATYVKATLIFIPPLLVAALAAATGAGIRKTVGVLTISALIYAACLAPWWARNYAVVGQFVAFTTGAGQNLYLGNNPQNKRGGNDWNADVEPDVVARIRTISSEIEQQRAFVSAASDFIRSDPLAFLRHMVVKFIRFWNIVPNAESYKGAVFQIISAASFGPVLILALVCAFAGYARRGLAIPIYALIAFFSIVHAVTIASLRYRLPLEPFLIAMAAEPLRRLIEATQVVIQRRAS